MIPSVRKELCEFILSKKLASLDPLKISIDKACFSFVELLLSLFC